MTRIDLNDQRKILKRDKKTDIEMSIEGVISAPERNWGKCETRRG